MLLNSLKLANILSYGPAAEPLALGPLNVLIGPNGSGKSNLVEAIGLLQSAPRELTLPVFEGGGIADWLWKGDGGSPVATIEALVDYPAGEMALRYRLSFTAVAQRLELTDERVENETAKRGAPKPYFYFGYENGRPMLNVNDERRELKREDVNPQQSILSQRKDPDHYPELTHLGSRFSAMRIYRDWGGGRCTAPRRPQPTDLPNDSLSEDYRNLGLVLNRLRRQPAVRDALTENLRLLYPAARDVDVAVEGGTVQVFLQEARLSVPATRLSDGTLRWLCLLTILLHPEPPPLVCIEEPEIGLHPDILPSVAKLLRDASSRMQLVVTTHSDVLVDALTDTPEVVVVCENDDASTRCRRLDAAALAVWLEKYTLGQLWRSGEIGGNRW
ncbi:MAG: AAA family ATPase [Myxococcota bacterium]|nr:AAA family ATPase [Myxococcota bacterium]